MADKIRMKISIGEHHVDFAIDVRELCNTGARLELMDRYFFPSLASLIVVLNLDHEAAKSVCDERGWELLELSAKQYWTFANTIGYIRPTICERAPDDAPHALGVLNKTLVTMNQNVSGDELPNQAKELITWLAETNAGIQA